MSKNGKQVGIKELAEELGLTMSTISRALNNNPRISEETRKRVQKLAKSRNYRHNAAAASLRTGKSKTFGVIIPLANRSFFASVISSIESKVNESDYRVIICQTNEDFEKEKAAIDTMLEATVDGIAISVSAETQDFSHFDAVKEAGIPLILFDRTYDEVGANQVLIDDKMGARMATEHLLKQGCSSILHIGGPRHMSIYRKRTQGYLEAMAAAGKAIVDRLVVETNARENTARELVTAYLEQGIHFDGVMASSDYSAIGAMKVLQAAGKRIPEDVAIVGFSDEPFTNWVTPGLSTVNQHSHEMGETVAELFLSLENNSKRKSSASKKIVLMPELVIRGSSTR